MSTIEELAQIAFDAIERASRDNGDGYYRVKATGAPEFVKDAIFAAHGSGETLPDDYVYEIAREAFEWIADNGDDDDAHDFADSGVDVYNAQLIEWLASSVNRAGYCDQAQSEGLVESRGIMTLIRAGQYVERCEIYTAVLESLRETFEAQEDNDSDHAVDVESEELNAPRGIDAEQ